MLDQAKLACVAYAEVKGSDGSSTLTNSGVYTTIIAPGTYLVQLPSATGAVLGLTQTQDRDLIFVQVKGPNPLITAAETDADPANKLVYIGSSPTTAAMSDFCVIIWRTLIPPPVGAPA